MHKLHELLSSYLVVNTYSDRLRSSPDSHAKKIMFSVLVGVLMFLVTFKGDQNSFIQTNGRFWDKCNLPSISGLEKTVL